MRLLEAVFKLHHTQYQPHLLQRRQPELVTSNMRIWANFLREQAQRKNVPIIDTNRQPLDQVVEMIQSQVLPSLVEA